jgi:DNA-binding LacI/PurR family transcriptional regulator
MKKVTVREVADFAGVAVGTVSRVVNKHEAVNPALRKRVEEAIRKLNYLPPTHRGTLDVGAPTISFVLSNRRFLHPVHSLILQGVEEHCRNLGYLVLYTSFEYRPETPWDELTLPKLLTNHRIADCLILVGMNYENLLVALQNANVSYVYGGNKTISGKPLPPFDSVRWDERAAAYEATRYLLQLGHERIGYIGDITLPWYAKPYEGYRQALREASLEPISQTIALSADPYENGRLGMELLLRYEPRATAVVAECNVLYGAWEACRATGLLVPQDISLIALGEQYGLLNALPVTNVSVDMTLVGESLARMAVAKIKSLKAPIPEVILPTTLVPRGTCKQVASQMETVAR